MSIKVFLFPDAKKEKSEKPGQGKGDESKAAPKAAPKAVSAAPVVPAGDLEVPSNTITVTL
jgi:TctA family transporter